MPQPTAGLAVLLLATLGLTLSLTLLTPSRLSPWALGLVCAAWLPGNGAVEGPTLWVMGPDHGLTVADLLSVVGFAAAFARLVLDRPRPPRRLLHWTPAGAPPLGLALALSCTVGLWLLAVAGTVAAFTQAS
jgi:hypothetical protein